MSRPSWDEYFMFIANATKIRSTCNRRQVGCVIVKDNRIISSGYNGAPSHLCHCESCIRQEMNIPSGERHEICKALHAEQNAITQAARFGVSIDGATIYITHQPCAICAKLIIACNIKRVVFENSYPDDFAMGLIKESGVIVDRIKINHE